MGRDVARPAVIYIKAVALWFGFAAIASAVAVAREAVMVQTLGEHRAHQLATLLLCGLVLAAIVAFVRVMAFPTRLAWRIGWLWLALGLWFEFAFGRLLLGIPWARLLADYDLAGGA